MDDVAGYKCNCPLPYTGAWGFPDGRRLLCWAGLTLWVGMAGLWVQMFRALQRGVIYRQA